MVLGLAPRARGRCTKHEKATEGQARLSSWRDLEMPQLGVGVFGRFRPFHAILRVMREFLRDWGRLIYLTALWLAGPVLLWALLVWLGVLG